MSFTLSYEVFKNPQIAMESLRKIYTFGGYDSLKRAKKVADKIKAIEHHFSAYTQQLTSINQIEDAEEKKSELEKLHAKEFQLETKKFEKKELFNIKFTPAEITIIEQLADESIFH